MNCIKLKNIYCEAESKPENWRDGWDFTAGTNKVSIEWGYKK
jgi:hypothetical protein